MYLTLFLFFVHLLAIVIWALIAYISETKVMRNLNIAASIIWALCAVGDIARMIEMSRVV